MGNSSATRIVVLMCAYTEFDDHGKLCHPIRDEPKIVGIGCFNFKDFGENLDTHRFPRSKIIEI
jgi:hypothetical protein